LVRLFRLSRRCLFGKFTHVSLFPLLSKLGGSLKRTPLFLLKVMNPAVAELQIQILLDHMKERNLLTLKEKWEKKTE
jgi:hypothetical protein